MNIVHIALRGPYTDYWGYQENTLPRVQAGLGHQVTVIATCFKFNSSCQIVPVEPGSYVLNDDVKIIRLPEMKKYKLNFLNKLVKPFDIYSLLEENTPNLIMLHGLTAGISADHNIIKYIRKHKNCVLVSDTHECEINTNPISTTLKQKILRRIYVETIRRTSAYCKKIYGITPACISYAEKYFDLSKSKMELLPLGYDPDLVDCSNVEVVRKEFRQKHGIPDEDIVIIHGGKITKERETPVAIKAVSKLEGRKHLVIFGAISENQKEEIESQISSNDFVIYLGELTQAEYYEAYMSADIALFPGSQSVLWQEAIGCGLPLVVAEASQLEYLDVGGNIKIVSDFTPASFTNALKDIITNQRYLDMKLIAQTKGRAFFSYERIANQISRCVDLM